jgi:hypothetical protein
MSKLVPVTDELLDQARGDSNLRRQLVAEHLDQLTMAMGRTKNRNKLDAVATRHLQEGARLAVKLTEILHGIARKSAR